MICTSFILTCIIGGCGITLCLGLNNFDPTVDCRNTPNAQNLHSANEIIIWQYILWVIIFLLLYMVVLKENS